MEGSGRGLI